MQAEYANKLKMKADQGDIESQWEYGLILYKGTGIAEDKAEAARYWKAAAYLGHMDSQWAYGCVLFDGNGISSNKQEAISYWKMAAEQGHIEALYQYGIQLYVGNVIKEDRAMAATCFAKAAEQGHASAQSQLGICLYRGDGVAHDEVEAARHWHMSAEGGDINGQFNYAASLFYGIGASADKVEAKKYYELAANQLKEGPAQTSGWALHDTGDDNSFYNAVAKQMVHINHPFLLKVPQGEKASVFLKRHLQNTGAENITWQSHDFFDKFVREFPDITLAMIHARCIDNYTDMGFSYRYFDNDSKEITYVFEDDTFTNQGMHLPNRPQIRLLSTGSEFTSVIATPKAKERLDECKLLVDSSIEPREELTPPSTTPIIFSGNVTTAVEPKITAQKKKICSPCCVIC